MRILFFLLFLAPVTACLGLMIRVWFGLQELHSRLSGLGVSDHSLQPDSGDLGLDHTSNRSILTDSDQLNSLVWTGINSNILKKILKYHEPKINLQRGLLCNLIFNIHFIIFYFPRLVSRFSALGDGPGWCRTANTLTIHTLLPIFIFILSNLLEILFKTINYCQVQLH